MGQKQKIVPLIEIKHQPVSLAALETILTLQLYLHWGFSSDHDKLLKQISQLPPLIAFCFLLCTSEHFRVHKLDPFPQKNQVELSTYEGTFDLWNQLRSSLKKSLPKHEVRMQSPRHWLL